MQRDRRRKPANDTERQSLTLWRDARPIRAMTLLYGSGYDRDARHEFLTAVAGVSPSDATDFATDRHVTHLWPDIDQKCDPQWTTKVCGEGCGMATWRHKTHPAITNPDSDPWGGLVATFDDGSAITMVYRGSVHDPEVDSAPRRRYAYTINQREIPRTVEANEIRSGCGDPISYTRALSSLCSFLGADAEHYAGHHNAGCCGRSLAYLEWADSHEDEIWSLQDELDLINSADSHQPPI